MMRNAFRASVFVSALVSISTCASAQIPDATSTISQAPGFPGNGIVLVGSTSGMPDNCSDGKCGRFEIILRSGGTTITNSPRKVWLDFSGCASDCQISCDQLTSVTGQTFEPGRIVSAITNVAGIARFDIQGASNVTSRATGTPCPGTSIGTACVRFWAEDGLGGAVEIAAPRRFAALDVNGLGSPSSAVSAADASAVIREAVCLCTPQCSAADYNFDGIVNAADVSAAFNLVVQAGLGTGTQKTAPYCP